MGESLSPDRVFDFPKDEPEPHPAYDFFAPGPLPGYAAMTNELMVVPAIEEAAEPVAEAEEEQVVAPDDDFEDDDFSDVDSEEVEEEEEGPSFPHSAPELPIPPSVIEDLSTHLGNLEYEHGKLVKKAIQVSDIEVAAGVSIREIGPSIFAIEGQVQVMASDIGRDAAEKRSNSAAIDYGLGDEQPS
nr:hypothetical protein [Tanacetum cinerariifolium]